jgi:hypothetical protein
MRFTAHSSKTEQSHNQDPKNPRSPRGGTYESRKVSNKVEERIEDSTVV